MISLFTMVAVGILATACFWSVVTIEKARFEGGGANVIYAICLCAATLLCLGVALSGLVRFLDRIGFFAF